MDILRGEIMKIFRTFLLCLSLITAMSVSACSSLQQGVRTTEIPNEQNDYVLGTGDVLRITVFGQENLSGEYKVEPSGAIAFPLIQQVNAAGYTAREVEADITDRLDPEYIISPRVSIEVLNYRNMYILGEVQQPGKYEFVPNMTVLQAVALAGGYTYRADENGAEVTRHVKGALKTFTVDEVTMLKPGDTIVVKRRWF